MKGFFAILTSRSGEEGGGERREKELSVPLPCGVLEEGRGSMGGRPIYPMGGEERRGEEEKASRRESKQKVEEEGGRPKASDVKTLHVVLIHAYYGTYAQDEEDTRKDVHG